MHVLTSDDPAIVLSFIEFDYVEATVTAKVTAKTLSAADSDDQVAGAPRRAARTAHQTGDRGQHRSGRGRTLFRGRRAAPADLR